MHLSLIQFVCTFVIGCFVFLCLFARARVPLAKHPALPGVAYRVLHSYNYLRPPSRVCPGCGYSNVATALRCANPSPNIDHSSLPYDLSQPHEFFTNERTRQWGLRTLIGLIVLAALSVGNPLVIYAALGATLIWIVIPMIACQVESGVTFSLVAVVSFAATAVVHFVLSPHRQEQLRTVGHSPLSTMRVPLVHVSLSTGNVTTGMLWVNIVCAVAALIGVGLSVLGHTQNTQDDFYGPISVLSLGITLSGFLLAAISTVQRFSGAAALYLWVSVAASGWLLGAFLARAFVKGVYKIKPLPRQYWNPGQLRTPRRPAAPPRPARGDLSEQIAYIVQRIAASTRHSASVVCIQCVNGFVRAFAAVANMLIRALHWIVLYIQAIITTLVKDLVLSFPILFRIATSGFRVAMFAPAMLVGASVLAAASADEAHVYLLSGGPIHMLWSILCIGGAALGVAIAAALYVQWSVVPSFLTTVQEEYLAQTIVFFAIFLDVYGLERLVVHKSSHFGLVSWMLNVGLVLIMSPGFIRLRARAKSSPTP